MFNLLYQERLAVWRDFRCGLETDPDPVNKTIDFWNKVPEVSIQADPWDQTTWPDPWEMVHENVYCKFVKILAICYTLQLTDRFSGCDFEINIVQDKNNCETKYLLQFGGLCVGYDNSKTISISELPENLVVEKSYAMPRLQ
jgi:hypothetical protein